MKITDSTIVLHHAALMSAEQSPSRELQKALSAAHHNDVKNSSSRTLAATDVVSLTVQAKSNSVQGPSAADAGSGGQSGTDGEANGNEAVIQLIEMLTGMKVKMLTQADLMEDFTKKNKDAAAKSEALQQQESPSPEAASLQSGAESPGEATAVADGKEATTGPGTVLPKGDAAPASHEAGVTGNEPPVAAKFAGKGARTTGTGGYAPATSQQRSDSGIKSSDHDSKDTAPVKGTESGSRNKMIGQPYLDSTQGTIGKQYVIAV